MCYLYVDLMIFRVFDFGFNLFYYFVFINICVLFKTYYFFIKIILDNFSYKLFVVFVEYRVKMLNIEYIGC